jgi:hypothetical protein
VYTSAGIKRANAFIRFSVDGQWKCAQQQVAFFLLCIATISFALQQFPLHCNNFRSPQPKTASETKTTGSTLTTALPAELPLPLQQLPQPTVV